MSGTYNIKRICASCTYSRYVNVDKDDKIFWCRKKRETVVPTETCDGYKLSKHILNLIKQCGASDFNQKELPF